jgi:transcription initiation factor TFIIH subunit 4
MASFVQVVQQDESLTVAYSDSSVVLGVFRLMSPLAQHLAMTFLFTEKIEEKLLVAFASDEASVDNALGLLKSLRVFLSQPPFVFINPQVAESLKKLLAEGPRCSYRSKKKPDRHKPTADQIQHQCDSNYNKILRFLVGLGERPSMSLIRLLGRCGLVASGDGSDKTSECFRFLLLCKEAQLTELLCQYVQDSADRPKTLSAVFNISLASPMQDYINVNLDPAVLVDWNELGLIYRCKPKAKRFYASPMVVGLLTDSSRPISRSERFLFIETNFRVIAHTASDIQIILLSYFLALEYRLPALVIGTLTRESVRSALQDGLLAAQIIEFLQMYSIRGEVPENVMKQLNLWESERNRVSATAAVMLDEFVDMAVYRSTLAYTQQTSAYLWHDADRRVIVIEAEASERVSSFLKNQERL